MDPYVPSGLGPFGSQRDEHSSAKKAPLEALLFRWNFFSENIDVLII